MKSHCEIELPYAEDINYWKTSRSFPDAWIDKSKSQIEKLGGTVLAEAFGNEPATGRAAYMLQFEIHGNGFKVVWKVLPTKSGNEKAARIQAATMLYHDIKAKCVSATVKGARTAFFEYLLLDDGRTAPEATMPELAEGLPLLMTGQLLIERKK